ncbi:MAG TPA: CHC2 zinc finger domain-containing protein [Candidatus Eisenbacteria bacterium]|nr:CHC2 zinc finger domain-containing protein [Candidatus Eisenbacteria bacterium]
MENHASLTRDIAFEYLKKKAPIDAVLSKLGLIRQLEVVGNGNEIILGKCPICSEEHSFLANMVQGIFNCSVCRARGDVIDFVAAFRMIKKSEAAAWLASIFVLAEETSVEASVSADREEMICNVICNSMAQYFAAVFVEIGKHLMQLGNVELIREELLRYIRDQYEERSSRFEHPTRN